MFLDERKSEFFRMVRTGRLGDDLIKFVTAERLTEYELRLMGESLEPDRQTPLLVTIEHSFKPMFLVEKMNAPIGQ